jgi:hypothetical protein
MDADYLKRTVGEPLASGLTAMLVKQPEDPVDFLGAYLLDYVQRNEESRKRQFSREMSAKLLDESFLTGASDMSDRHKVSQVKLDTRKKDAEKVVAELADVKSESEAFHAVINMLVKRVGATNAYIGKKTTADGHHVVQFVADTIGAKMNGKLLRGSPAGEDESEDGEEEGVLFRLWKKTEPGIPAEVQLDEDGNPIEAEEPEPVPPEHVHIENVMREPAMKYFGIPKLGGFLAVPVSYNSWLHPGGMRPVSPVSKTEDEERKGDEEEEEEEKASSDDVGGDGVAPAEDQGPPEDQQAGEVEQCPFEMNTIRAELALCMHKMGHGTKFTNQGIAEIKYWATQLSSALEGLEKRLFDAEVKAVGKLKEASECLASTRVEADAMIQEAAAATEEGASDIKKTLIKAQARYQASQNCIMALGEYLRIMSSLSLSPCMATDLHVLLLALKWIGVAKEELLCIDGSLDWRGKVRGILKESLAQGVKEFDPRSEETTTTLDQLKEEVENLMPDEELEKLQPVCAALAEWMKAALALSEAATALRVEEEEAAAEAAAKAAEGEPQEGASEDAQS